MQADLGEQDGFMDVEIKHYKQRVRNSVVDDVLTLTSEYEDDMYFESIN